LFEAGHHTLLLGSMADYPPFSESLVVLNHQADAGRDGESGLVQLILAEFVVKPTLNIGLDRCCAPEL
jgi:hypothetical protein